MMRDARDIADAVLHARERRTPLRIVSGGSWLDAGRPTDPEAQLLHVGANRGILEYVPGDLTLTALAGTPLSEIDAAVRAHGQWLPLDPLGDDCSSLGATLATASAGALAGALGFARDLTLGVEFVDGRGIVVRGGGRVVKNVAGFDLVRLLVGSWGTLGVLTSATVRLRARPERESTFALAAPTAPGALATLLRSLRAPSLAPLAMELMDAPIARALGVDVPGAVVLLRLAGNEAALTGQQRRLAQLGDLRELPSAVWTSLRQMLPSDSWTLRCSTLPSRLADLWEIAGAAGGAPAHAWRTASVARGVVRLVLPRDADHRISLMVGQLSAHGRVVGERLPATVWSSLPSPAADPLSVRLRDAFDPDRLLNRGLMEVVA